MTRLERRGRLIADRLTELARRFATPTPINIEDQMTAATDLQALVADMQDFTTTTVAKIEALQAAAAPASDTAADADVTAATTAWDTTKAAISTALGGSTTTGSNSADSLFGGQGDESLPSSGGADSIAAPAPGDTLEPTT